MDIFSSLIGQERAGDMLQKSLQTGTVSHAYLFLGPAGVGKMSYARTYGEAIISQHDKEAGVFFREKLHPDLLILEKEEGRSVISKEQITDELEPWLGLKPYRAYHRVAIVRDSQLMSNEAANALLKSLEEPPGHSIIILIADDQNLPETVVSRCQVIRFSPLRDKDIEQILLNRGVGAFEAIRAARLGQGSVALALCFAKEEDYDKVWEISRDIFMDLSQPEIIGVYNSAERMEKSPELIANLLISLLRDINIYRQTGKVELLVLPESAELAASLEKVQSQRITAALDRIMSLKNYYRSNVNNLIININLTHEIWQAFNA